MSSMYCMVASGGSSGGRRIRPFARSTGELAGFDTFGGPEANVARARSPRAGRLSRPRARGRPTATARRARGPCPPAARRAARGWASAPRRRPPPRSRAGTAPARRPRPRPPRGRPTARRSPAGGGGWARANPTAGTRSAPAALQRRRELLAGAGEALLDQARGGLDVARAQRRDDRGMRALRRAEGLAREQPQVHAAQARRDEVDGDDEVGVLAGVQEHA